MPKRCAFLTLQDPTGFVIDDELAYPPLRALGWQVEAVPWRQPPTTWQRFELVVVRSPWDYQDDPEAFLGVLADIEASTAHLVNGLETCRWNLDKTYLRDVAERQVEIVPTVWRNRLEPGDLERVVTEIDADQLVVKPVVSANADGAFRLRRNNSTEVTREVESYYANRPLMAQPFVEAVIAEGEYSLFYFNGAYSHCVSKTPKTGDFRVQEEHGGLIERVDARPGSGLRRTADAVIDAISQITAVGQTPLYARVDLVRSNDDPTRYWLMELELIEPALYLRMDDDAPERFARAVDDCFNARPSLDL